MRSDWCATMLALTMAGLCGCARTKLESSVVDRASGSDMELDYWEGIETSRVVTNNDALQGLLLVADGEAPYGSYDERVGAAKARGWVGHGWDAPANESATVGMMARAACQIMDIRGGLTMMVFGPSERYCARELISRGMIPQRTQNQSLSGLEFSDFVRKIERNSPLETPAQPVVDKEVEENGSPAPVDSGTLDAKDQEEVTDEGGSVAP